jgi:ABC-type dipeptide/oligopeptide/nickel transport system permease component
MAAYLGRRLLTSLLVLVGVSALTFGMLHLVPGDPVTAILGRQAVSAERIAALRAQLGLDQPLLVQYAAYVGGALHGDFGRSIRSERPVLAMIAEALPSTLQLASAALLFAVLAGFGLGLLAAVRRGRWPDLLVTTVAVSGISIPSFWLGMLLILVFSVWLGWLPSVASQGDWRGLILPALTLAVAEAAVIARVVRSSVVEALNQEYMRTAVAKGLPPLRRLLRHALPNALIPVVTVVGLQAGFLLAGSVVVETVFARPGLGRLAISAVSNRDFPVVQGVVLVTAAAYVLINTFTDLLYAALDPRVRLD